MIWTVGIFLVGVGIWAPLLHRDMKRAVLRIAESARRTEQAEALRAAYLRAAEQLGNLGALIAAVGVSAEVAAARLRKAFGRRVDVDQSAP